MVWKILLGLVGAVAVVAGIWGAFIAFYKIKMKKVHFNAKGINTEPSEGVVEYHEDAKTPYLLKRNADGSVSDKPFKLLVTTDLHLSELTDNGLTLSVLDRLIKREKPDFVILNGDVAVSCQEYWVHESVCEFFETRNLYWAYTMGNHDGEDRDAPEKRALYISAFDTQKYPHCIMKNDESASFGYTNCIINVKGSRGQIIESIILMDSGTSRPAPEWYVKYGFEPSEGDDFIKPSQIAWYKKRLAELTEENNGVKPKSLVFFHIPLPQMKDAFARFRGTEQLIYGYKIEGVCSCGIDTGFFDAAKNSGSTEAVVFGHEHDNDFCVEMDGIKLLYSQSLSYLAYNARRCKSWQGLYKLSLGKLDYFTDGCTLFMIKDGEPTDIVPKLNSDDKSVFRGLEDRMLKRGLVI